MATKQEDYRKILTGKIVAMIKEGAAPWQKPWDDAFALPKNPVTGKRYKGMNALWLMVSADQDGYKDPRWCTYKQAQKEGWQVRRGEKGTLVEYWKFDARYKDTPENRRKLDEKCVQYLARGGSLTYRLERPCAFYSVVFNGSQIDGIPEFAPGKTVPNVERADELVRLTGAKVCASLSTDRHRAAYSPLTDEIRMPPRSAFEDEAGYYGTLLHELGHWTGHESRLGRDLSGGFGTPSYAYEELVAELSSLYLGEEMGLRYDPANNAAYLGHWIQALENDHNMIFRAAREADQAASFLLAFENRATESPDEDEMDPFADTQPAARM